MMTSNRQPIASQRFAPRVTTPFAAIAATLVLMTLSSAAVSSRQQPDAAAQGVTSPAVARVVATYDETMGELRAMMAGGGTQTERMTALESRLSREVAAAEADLRAAVRTGDAELAKAAAFGLQYATDADAAVTALIAALDRFDGGLVNNIGLALMQLSLKHAALKVPVSPLVAALQASEWNRQQKIAQVLEVLVDRGGVTDPDGALTAALIPMLASQRVRVFRPAREMLPKITGQRLGNTPEPWVAWFGKRYGRTIDIGAGIYELAQIVRPTVERSGEIYRVESAVYRTHAALFARLQADAAIARGLGRTFGAVIQVPAKGFPQDRLTKLAEALFTEVKPDSLVISPIADEFVPFTTALRNLRGRTSAAAAGR